MKRIIICDDEPSLARAIKDRLVRLGFDVTIVKNGLIALNLLSVTKYDLVILDMVMPVMGGLQFLKELNALGIKVPIIALSNNNNGIMVDALKLGVLKYYVKTDVSMQELGDYVIMTLKVVNQI